MAFFESALDVLLFKILSWVVKLALYFCTESVYLYKLFKGPQPESAFIYIVVSPEQFISYFFESHEKRF